MSTSIFTEVEFWLLIGLSFLLPVWIYWSLLSKRTVAQLTVLLLGVALVGIAALDVYLLQALKSLAQISPSLADDAIFASEVSVALYLLPAMFGGVGINLVSHVLINHLHDAEKRYKNEHPDS